MEKMHRIKGSLPLLLISAILILCAGFFIVSCGNKSQQKTKNADKGAYAIDFSHCPASVCSASPKGSPASEVPDISNQQLTLEAWIKTSVTSTTGTIFNRSDGARGVELIVEENVPKFRIRHVIEVAPGVTSTEPFTVSSAFTLVTGTWYHIAGLMSSADVHVAEPHLDIYINGEYKNSETTASNYAENPANEDMVIGPLNDAVIDELRFWGSRRTETEINNCMSTELGIGGECDRGDHNLAAYYRLNEGEGADVTDFSGNGFSGGFEYTVGPDEFEEWEDGWVTPGAPITAAD